MKLRLFLLTALFAWTCLGTAEAQIPNMKKLKRNVPAIGKKKNKKKKEEAPAEPKAAEKKETQPTESTAAKEPEKPKVDPTKALIEEVKAQQAKQISEGTATLIKNEYGSAFGGDKETIENAYLTFTSDYDKPDMNKVVFEPNDFIYAKVHLPKKITEILPGRDNKYLEYYRVVMSVEMEKAYSGAENSHKIPETTRGFADAYSKETVLVPVLPGKGFYENIKEEYMDDKGEFADIDTEIKAYENIIARNFSRQLAKELSELEPGFHKIKVSFTATAKLNRSYYHQITGITGYFVIEITEESKAKQEAAFDLLTNLYDYYEGEHSLALSRRSIEKEKEMLAKMTPAEREVYQIAKRSPHGYMAAFSGKKHKVTFRAGPNRSKNAYVDISWPKAGDTPSLNAGNSSVMITKSSTEVVEVPANAKISINGRTLVPSLNGAKTVTLYWNY